MSKRIVAFFRNRGEGVDITALQQLCSTLGGHFNNIYIFNLDNLQLIQTFVMNTLTCIFVYIQSFPLFEKIEVFLFGFFQGDVKLYSKINMLILINVFEYISKLIFNTDSFNLHLCYRTLPSDHLSWLFQLIWFLIKSLWLRELPVACLLQHLIAPWTPN